MANAIISTGIGEVAGLAKDLIDRWIPDKSQAEKDALAADLQLQLAQIQANAAEATQPGFHFRDGAGWVCVIAMGFDFIFRPLAIWVATLLHYTTDFPALDVTILGQMLFALLGLGGMHMYENVKGTK